MHRLAVLALIAGGCSKTDDAPADAAPNRFRLDRPCLHSLAAGGFGQINRDGLFITYGCPGGGEIAESASYGETLAGNGGHCDWADHFIRAKVVADVSAFPGNEILATYDTGRGMLAFGGAGGFLRVGYERPYSSITPGDLDGDAHTDFVVVGDHVVRRTLAESTTYGLPLQVHADDEKSVLADKPFAHVAIAQLGGSDLPDLFYVTTDGELGVAIQTAPDTFAVQTLAKDPGTPLPLIAADVDGDGLRDVVGAAGHVFVWSSKAAALLQLAEPASEIAIGNTDIDATLEPIFMTADRTAVRRVKVTDAGLASVPLLDAGGDAMVVGDFDADYRSDVVVIHQLDAPESWLQLHTAFEFHYQ
jgi:hypothetical protein